MIGCVSGSPSLVLNSKVLTSSSEEIIKPAYKNPVNGCPSFIIPSKVGRMISRMTLAWIWGVTIGAGEYAPIPPVLGPWSWSNKRLWSCEVAKGKADKPLHRTMKLASWPSKNSSITTLAPPSLCITTLESLRSMSSIAWWACSKFMATTTPLPAARPSALITIGTPC